VHLVRSCGSAACGLCYLTRVTERFFVKRR
jgi:hypothetical protein